MKARAPAMAEVITLIVDKFQNSLQVQLQIVR